VRSGLLRLPLLVFLLAPSALAVTIDWVMVGDPGNACDPQGGAMGGCFGSVAEPYRISKFEVINAQYAEFLNAVAPTDTHALYNRSMGSVPLFGGITRSGSSVSYAYSAIVGRENKPVNYVSFYDSLRFANWLHNGQPTGVQDNSTTEDGAYTLTPTGIADNTVTRNAGAEVFVPSEDEWHKAAYYDAVLTSYFDYPAGSDTQTGCTAAGVTANTANCLGVVSDLTDVGSYMGAASPSGTFDQGGNVWEWNETILLGSLRGLRGGSFDFDSLNLAASEHDVFDPTFEASRLGFRVASPVPASPVPFLSPIAIP